MPARRATLTRGTRFLPLFPVRSAPYDRHMPTIHSLLRAVAQAALHEESLASAHVTLAEIIANHRAAGHEVQEGLHDGRRAWHVSTPHGDPLAVFWITEEGALE